MGLDVDPIGVTSTTWILEGLINIVRVDEVLPGEEVHRAVEFVVGRIEVDEGVVLVVGGIAIAGSVIETESQSWLPVHFGEGIAAFDVRGISKLV